MNLRPAMAHQERALEYANGRQNLALFMEMRLGKTMVAIRWAKPFKGRKLIVAPLSVLPSWHEELLKEGIPENIIFSLREDEPSDYRDDSWWLVNYEHYRARFEDVMENEWECAILDESTKIRNMQAQVTKLFIKNRHSFKYRAILSGLPAPESPMDYFAQFMFLNGTFCNFDDFWKWRMYFFHTLYSDWDWIPRPGAVSRIKEQIHKHAFVLTRKQVDIGSKKIYEKRYVEMSPRQSRMYKDVMKKFEYGDNIQQATKWAIVKFIWLARIAGGFSPEKEILSDTKVKELLSLLEGELSDQQVVVWFRFNAELENTKRILQKAKISCLGITGKTTVEERGEYSVRFREGKIRVMLCQVKCGKFGLNWSNASTAIYYSNAYDMEDRAQSEDRILHPTKREPLLYIDLITRKTIDQSVVETLRDKYANSRIFMTQLIKNWVRSLK